MPPTPSARSPTTLQPQFDYANGKQMMRGYLARNVVEVRVDDVARVGSLIEVSVSAGGTTVQGIRFDLKARERSNARRSPGRWPTRGPRAAAAAKAPGRPSCGRADRGRRASSPPDADDAGRHGRASAPPPIAPGETIIRATVTLTASERPLR